MCRRSFVLLIDNLFLALSINFKLRFINFYNLYNQECRRGGAGGARVPLRIYFSNNFQFNLMV